MKDRILWNRRPTGYHHGVGGDIDEIVVHNCTVHVEQMDDRCWWIGVTKADGTGWMGVFTADSRGRMGFTETENYGLVWDRDETQEPKETT